MKALKVVLLVVVLLGLGIMAGCQESHARRNGMMEYDRIEFEQGLTGFPRPVVLYP